MPRHPAGDRVDRVLDVDAPRLEQLGELADPVLRLGDGEAVARDDDHRGRVGELDRGVVHATPRGREPPAPAAAPTVPSPPPNPPSMMLITERFIASAMSLVRIAPEAPTRAPRDDQDRVVEHEAGHRDRRAGERVEQRDHDRHVGAADRQRHRDAEDQRGEPGPRRGRRGCSCPIHRYSDPPTTTIASRRVTSWPPGIMTGRDGVIRRPISLPEAISEPVNVIEPMITSSDGGDVVHQRRDGAREAEVLVDGDQGRRAAADRVEQRHQLGHRRHLHGAGGVQAVAAADGDAGEDDDPAGRR